MNLLEDFFDLIQRVIFWIIDLIRKVWDWSVQQISNVPWASLGDLPWWKVVILVLTAGGVGYLLYQAGKILYEAGESTLNALSTLLNALAKTLLPVLLAGVVATVGAWIINNVYF